MKRKRLTGDVAVVVGAVVVLQERDQCVQEVMWTQQDQFLQHICGSKTVCERHHRARAIRPCGCVL